MICFVLCFLISIFASEKKKKGIIMCTVTLSYDQSNALARRKLAALLATGLFSQLPTDDTPQPTPEEVEAHRQEVEEFLYGSKILAAKAFARHL